MMATNGVLSCEGGMIWISRRRAMMPAVCSPGETSATSASAAARRRCELFISWGRSTSAGSLCCPRRGSGTPYKQTSKLTGAEVMPATDESSPWPPDPSPDGRTRAPSPTGVAAAGAQGTCVSAVESSTASKISRHISTSTRSQETRRPSIVSHSVMPPARR